MRMEHRTTTHCEDNGGIFKNPMQEFTAYRTYSRYLPKERRRETYPESIERLLSHLDEPNRKLIDNVIRPHLLDLNVFPSMRYLWSAGAAVDAENAMAYNCAYMKFDKPEDFGDLMYLLMCGCGVGYTVERETLGWMKIEEDASDVYGLEPDEVHVVEDSRSGWAEAIRHLMSYWLTYGARAVTFDYSKLRPKGSILQTSGGRSSGPEALKECIDNIDRICCKRVGALLRPIDVFDICCHIAKAVIAGGIRRSATIALFDIDDEEMLKSKDGDWYKSAPWRSYGNISAVCYDSTCSDNIRRILEQAITNGEPGLVNRSHLWRKLKEHSRQYDPFVGVNPCGEVVLRPYQFCNLTEINVSKVAATQTKQLSEMLLAAAYLGLKQACLTNFSSSLNPKWKQRTEEDRLLGISLTGVMDSPSILNILSKLRHTLDMHIIILAQQVLNLPWRPTAITTVKPSGTVGVMADCSQGIHQRLGKHVQRSIRVSSHDPLAKMVADQGFPHTVCDDGTGDYLFLFYQECPQTASLGANVDTQLKIRQLIEDSWCRGGHQPSQTLYITDAETPELIEHLVANVSTITGITFFNMDNQKQLQKSFSYLPLMILTDEEAADLKSRQVPLDFSKLPLYESSGEDHTAPVRACSGGTSCSL